MYARLCREIKKNEQTGPYSLMGSFTNLRWTNVPVGFVCVVYWQGANETFRQSFALVDEEGTCLDETPAMECVLNHLQTNISSAFFYTIFPQPGPYNISVYQNGICIETVPLPMREAEQINDSYSAPFAPLAPLGIMM